MNTITCPNLPKIIAGIALAFISLNAVAQEQIKAKASKLEQATIFLRGAELTHTAKIPLNTGENVVEISGLSPVLDQSSIRVKSSSGAIISAFEYRVDQLADEKITNPKVRVLRDSIQICERAIEKLDIDVKINEDMLKFLSTGTGKNVSGSEQGLGIDELIKTMDYYKEKAMELQMRSNDLEQEKKKLNETIARLRNTYSLETIKFNRNEGILKVTVTSPMKTTTDFTVTYYTAQAGWRPYYDINITDTNLPVNLSYRSKIRQTTGLDWEKIKVTLSTSTPNTGKVAPLFNAWFLQPYSTRAPGYAKMSNRAVQNTFSYEMLDVSEDMAEQSIRVRGSSSLSGSSAPMYIINGIPATEDEVKSLDPSMIEDMSVLKDASSTQVYGSRAAGGVILITTKDNLESFLTITENTGSITYDIDLPYTIPGNGKEQTIDLRQHLLAADFKYYCAPKLDPDVYILAEISDWSSLGLLSGNANVTFDGTFLGETYIDATSTHQNLTLTLGTDKRVVVERTKLEDFSSTRTLGSDKQQIFTYKLMVRNNNSQPIKMVLKDQYPRSTQKSIEVTFREKETTPFTANNVEVGVISWEEELQPGETKTYNFSYSIKYPKDLNLNVSNGAR